MSIEIILAVFGALTAVFKWVFEYSNKLKWEKNKFLLEEIEKFSSIESTKNAQKILDWNSIIIKINDDHILVNDEILFESMQTHDSKHKFSSEEVKLRGLFDEYFDNLTKMVLMCKTGMIPENNFRLFMKYWFKILSGDSKNKSSKILIQIRKYLDFYGYNDLLNFIDNKK